MNETVFLTHYLYLLAEYRTVKDVQLTSYGALASQLQMRANSLFRQIENWEKIYPEYQNLILEHHERIEKAKLKS